MSKHEGSRYVLHHELESGLGQRGAVLLMEELQAIRADVKSLKEDVRHLEIKMDGKMDAMEARLDARIFRTALLVNVPSIMAAVGLSFAATRLG